MRIIFRTLLLMVLLLSAIGPFATAKGTLAQQSANISVTAGISSAMSITACDTTADFGTGLTALGGTSTGTQDQITMSKRGNPNLGGGTVYIWNPSCPNGIALFEVESTVPWTVATCAMENGGTSSLSIGGHDLGWDSAAVLQGTPDYTLANNSLKFGTSCQNSASLMSGSYGFNEIDLKYTLTVDLADSPGTFFTATTWIFMP
jgi:hypothetical protein